MYLSDNSTIPVRIQVFDAADISRGRVLQYLGDLWSGVEASYLVHELI